MGPADRMQEGSKEERRESSKIRGLWVCMSEVDGDDIRYERKVGRVSEKKKIDISWQQSLGDGDPCIVRNKRFEECPQLSNTFYSRP